MTRVVKIDGAPGCGKTHTLRQKLREEKRDGLEVKRFWWLNFSNSGRLDVEAELAEMFAGSNNDPTNRAKTFHGLALSLCCREGVIDPNEQQIIQQDSLADGVDHYAQFCEANGMRYEPDAANPRRLLAGEDDTDYPGNQLFAINDYLTQTCKDADQWHHAPTDISLEGQRVATLLERWTAYKKQHAPRLFEHGDYIKECYDRVLTPAVGVMLIDEFQDLAPQEYRLFKCWREHGDIDSMYIAGDPNQSIYSFRGGTPYFFEETTTDDTVTLKESWRCPDEIARVGRSMLSAHRATDPRGFEGRDGGGDVEWTTLRDKYDLRDAAIHATRRREQAPSVLFLTRTNYQLGTLEKGLRNAGIPFDVLGSRGGIWNGDLEQHLEFLTNVQEGSSGFAWPNAKQTLQTLTDGKQRMNATGGQLGGIIDAESLDPALQDIDDVWGLLERMQIKSWKRDVIENALDAPATMQPGKVQVGTIHTAKGLEAPAVYLFTETSKRSVRRYSRDEDHAAEEHRAYYVGATRASEELHLVNGFFDGPTAPPIKKVRQHSEVVA